MTMTTTMIIMMTMMMTMMMMMMMMMMVILMMILMTVVMSIEATEPPQLQVEEPQLRKERALNLLLQKQRSHCPWHCLPETAQMSRKMLAVALTLAVLLCVDWSYRCCPTESDPQRYKGFRCIIRKRLILWNICLVVFSLVVSRCYIISNHESSSSESMWVACFHHLSWCLTIHSTLGEKPGKKKHRVFLP